MKKRNFLLLISSILITLLSACGGGGGGGGSGGDETVIDTTAPYVISTNPLYDSTGEAINRSISVTFSESVDVATISETSFLLDSESGEIVEGTVSYDAASKTATFSSTTLLKTSTTYIATITTDVEDDAGNPIAEDYTWQFTTAPPDAIDAIPPVVVSRSPGSGDTSVATNTIISVTFSEAIDPHTIDSSAVTVSGDSSVPGEISLIGSTILFEPDNELSNDTTYVVTVSGLITDLAANPLGEDVSWSFTTGSQVDVDSPQLLSVSPADGETNVGTDTAIEATFNEAIQPFFFGIINGNPVAVSFNDDYTSVSLRPTSGLIANSTYTVSVQVSDQAGNRMDEAYTWEFTTAP